MNRLIDADVLVKIIDKHTNDENQLDDDITCILEEIPTVEAIPKEKVQEIVDRLEDLRAKPAETVYDTILIGSIIEIVKEVGKV